MSIAHSFLEVTLFVANVDRSAQFYRAVGVALFANEEAVGVRHYDGGAGDTAMQLWPADDGQVSRVQLGFRVDRIDNVAAKLEIMGVPYVLPGPNRLTTRDPDGNQLHISRIRDS